MPYVAIALAGDATTAYLYERTTEPEYGETTAECPRGLQPGTGRSAGLLVTVIVHNRDNFPAVAHLIAACTPRQLLPQRMADPLDGRGSAVRHRRAVYVEW